MDAIVYVNKPLKKINGTLFYCFEYFIFLKQYVSDLKFIFVHDYGSQHLNKAGDQVDLEYFKEVFKDKYQFNHDWLTDIVIMKPIPFMQARIRNVLIFDIHSYSIVEDYLNRAENVLVYSNKPEGQKYLNKKTRNTFYGWYDGYQFYNKKARLKLYKEIHKTFSNKGNKIFVCSPNGNNLEIISTLKLNADDVYIKKPNAHYNNLFENIGKIIYWHCGHNDANNRIIVESAIHNIPVEVYLNGYTNDSVMDRKTLIDQGQIKELYLTRDDELVCDFLLACDVEVTYA